MTPEYGGGWVYNALSNESHIHFWNQNLLDRQRLLLEAIGAEYDDEPLLSHVFCDETSGKATTNTAAYLSEYPDWNNAKGMAYYTHLSEVMADAFPNTLYFCYTNWGFLTADIPILMADLESRKHGFGGPDLWNRKKPGTDGQVYNNRFGDYYTTKPGVMPICVETQASGYLGGSAEELFTFGVDTVGVNFLPWGPYPPAGAVWTWEDAVAEVTRQQGRINTAIPTSLQVAE
jgi:hypothetical protein